jgi:hypothetical protein
MLSFSQPDGEYFSVAAKWSVNESGNPFPVLESDNNKDYDDNRLCYLRICYGNPNKEAHNKFGDD